MRPAECGACRPGDAPRFITDFDNLLLAHADRGRVLPEHTRKRPACRMASSRARF
ncbi:hypothetical protein [Amycolatopsis endophytica]|uniref:hypothetical protein n=1 Tax=Amycolatopsis endophytica TaxID=860233 RepID=UPI0015C6C1BA